MSLINGLKSFAQTFTQRVTSNAQNTSVKTVGNTQVGNTQANPFEKSFFDTKSQQDLSKLGVDVPMGVNQAGQTGQQPPVVTTKDRLRVRKDSMASGDNTLETFPGGTQLQVLAERNGMYLVSGTFQRDMPDGTKQWVKATGWVSKDYVQPALPPGSVPTLPDGATPSVNVGASYSSDPPSQDPVGSPVTGDGTQPPATDGTQPPATSTSGSSSVDQATGSATGADIVTAGRNLIKGLTQTNADGSTTFTKSYKDECLHFVTDVLAAAGVSDPLLSKATAAEAKKAVEDAGKLTACKAPPSSPMDGVPVGAVVFWDPVPPDTNGHAAIYAGMKNGKPQYLTAPVGDMQGPGERNIRSLATVSPWPDTSPAGWYAPGQSSTPTPATVG